VPIRPQIHLFFLFPLDFTFFSRFLTLYPRAAASGCPRADLWAPAIATGDSTAGDPPNKLKIGLFVAGEGSAAKGGRFNSFLTAGCRTTEEKKIRDTNYELRP